MTGFSRITVLSVAAALVLVSCATSKTVVSTAPENAALTETSMPVSSVVSPSVSASASSVPGYPEWVFTPSSCDDAEYKYFSGSSDITVSDRMARQRAMTDAASEFASWWEQSIETVISTSSSIVDDGGKQSYVQTFETRSKTSSSAVVSGLEAVDQWKNPETGELWLLTRVSKTLIGQTFRSVIDETTSMEEFKTDEGVSTVADTLKSSFDELLQKEK